MRHIILLFFTTLISSILLAQNVEDFEVLIKIPSTPLNDQQGSGTCWSFATTSFLETEAIRMGKEALTLSPMYYVTPTYLAKAEKFIETEGATWFGAGDLTFSVLDAYEKFGAIPESVYKGIVAEDWRHDQLEMDNLLLAMVESVGTSNYGRIKPNSWRSSIEAVLAAYIGKAPATFLYQNKLYSPQSFAREHVGINPNDYLEITSYSHEAYYEMMILDIPANWNRKPYLNIPLQDFERLVDYALEQAYSLAWDGDASEDHFNFEKGILRLNETEEKNTITQAWRQQTFEDETTTDDHNMHIIGMAKNSANEIYYILKNSEGANEMGGYIYMSKNALLLKTISLMVHKDAIPSDIKNKIN